MPPFKLLSGLAMGSCLLLGQAPNVVINSGYRVPPPLKVAPGQVITLFVRPSSIRLTSGINADPMSLPVSLGGFSATLRQSYSQPVAVPIFSVNPVVNCSSLSVTPVCNSLVAITVQIPFELLPNAERVRLPENFAAITVAENSVEGDQLPINPVPENIHILSSCDTTLQTVSPPCTDLVNHSDGSLVTPRNPAFADEIVTINAYGLGRTDGSNAVPEVKIGLLFGLNPDSADPTADPVSAVLAAGGTGVYGVSFKVPALPVGTAACSEAINSNLAVTIARGTSSGTVAICVRSAN